VVILTTAVADTEEYNGSSWTTSTALSGVVESLRGVGTQTAALAFGGQAPIYHLYIVETQKLMMVLLGHKYQLHHLVQDHK
jgi:hypothetical protein